MAKFDSQLKEWAERTLRNKLVEATKRIAVKVGDNTHRRAGMHMKYGKPHSMKFLEFPFPFHSEAVTRKLRSTAQQNRT